MPKLIWAFPLTLGLTVPLWAFASGAAQSVPVVPVELEELVVEKPAVSPAVPKPAAAPALKAKAPIKSDKTDDDRALDRVVSDLTAKDDVKTPEANVEANVEVEVDVDAEPDADADKKVDQTKDQAADKKVAAEPLPEPVYEALPADGPIVVVPAFFGLTPYVTSRDDVEKRFGDKARFYEDKRLGKRHIVTGEEFGIKAQSLLISYTVDGLVSDLYVRMPAGDREAVLETLRKMTAEMDPTGIWVREVGRDLWVTKKAVMAVSRAKRDGNFSLEYGAAARKAVETRAWLAQKPEDRCPHFAGLLVGGSDLAEVKKRIEGVKDCDMGDPILLSEGSRTYTLRGACFGIPGEVKSYVWFGADSGKLTRLEILSEGDPVGFESVLPALKKRFRPIDDAGLFETEHAPARNVWSPRIRFDAAGGKLEFWVETDGIKRAEAAYEEHVIQKKAREAQAKRVDSLFD